MDHETDNSPWQETTGNVVRPVAWGKPSTQLNASSIDAVWDRLTNLTAATESEFIVELTPCLQLVAPVGMDEGAQDMWFEAAHKALAGIPVDLLKRGAQHALMHADHPSKIVALIMREIEADWAWRKNNVSGHSDIWHGADNRPEALPAPGGERATKAELDEICKRFGVGRYAKERTGSPHKPTEQPNNADPERPCRNPTREDYIRLFGVDPDAPKAEAASDAA